MLPRKGKMVFDGRISQCSVVPRAVIRTGHFVVYERIWTCKDTILNT